MKKFKGLMTSLSEHWATPKSLYELLNGEFNFNCDPCPLHSTFDGLAIEWGSSTFVNPPYGRKIIRWVEKGYQESLVGKTVVMLLPARTDTEWFHRFVMYAKEVRWIKGRLKFGDSKNSAPFPSMIVIFSKEVR